MTSRSNDIYYYDGEEDFIYEDAADGEYVGPRKIKPENYMEARFSLPGHSSFISMNYRAANAATSGKNT